MSDLIERDDLYAEINGIYERHYKCSSYQFIHDYFRAIFRRIRNAPAVDAVPVVHGEWEKSKYFGFLCCSVCHDCYVDEEWVEDGRWNFCPNCGAKMGNGKL